MKKTPFPTHPTGVAPLTPDEFVVDIDRIDALSLDAVCALFVDDANRAVVWVIRFEALKALRERPDMADWFGDEARTSEDVSEVAARFVLNDRWEFDRDRFCSAVDALVSRRSGNRGA